MCRTSWPYTTMVNCSNAARNHKYVLPLTPEKHSIGINYFELRKKFADGVPAKCSVWVCGGQVRDSKAREQAKAGESKEQPSGDGLMTSISFCHDARGHSGGDAGYEGPEFDDAVSP